MAKIVIPSDCGNAPKKKFLRDLNVASVKGDLKFFQAILPDELTWEIVGQANIAGKDNVLKALTRHKLWKSKELVIDAVITHGREASVSGQFVTKDSSRYSYCDVFKFKSAGSSAIHSIKTFIVKHKP